MARAVQNLTIRLSVLDRLLDDEPAVMREPPLPTHQAMRRMIEAVRRDLQDLLNNRQSWIDDDVLDREHLSQSIACFGLPDFSTENMTTSDARNRLRKSIERAVAAFEPRLTRIVVTPERMEPHERHIRFRIDAMLRADPISEPVSFDTVVQSNGVAQVVAV